jgi:hypothetical protein
MTAPRSQGYLPTIQQSEQGKVSTGRPSESAVGAFSSKLRHTWVEFGKAGNSVEAQGAQKGRRGGEAKNGVGLGNTI